MICDDFRVWLLLAAEAGAAMYLLYRAGLLKNPRRIVVSGVLIAAAFVLRGCLFAYETLDYQNFLAHWAEYFRDFGGFRALKRPIGNYNIPYLYFLALFSYINIRDLYLIKLLSCLFDVLLAWAAALITKRVGKNDTLALALFICVLFWPTVVLNGALWGQCDSIYVALLLLGLYYALERRPILSLVLATLAFGFKLQAVFVLPIYAVLLIDGRIKPVHLLTVPLCYFLLILPAAIAGRPIMGMITLYIDQSSTVGSALNYNSPSVFAAIRNIAEPESAGRLGILAAGAVMALIILACFMFRRRLNDRAILAAALLFALCIPFLLPHMHERYFFASDILALIAAFTAAEMIPAAGLCEFASLLGYHAYLKMRFFLTMNYGAAALIVAIGFALIYFIRALAGADMEKGEILWGLQ